MPCEASAEATSPSSGLCTLGGIPLWGHLVHATRAVALLIWLRIWVVGYDLGSLVLV